MGSRCVYGFYKDGITKATYAHDGAELECCGQACVNFISSTTLEKMNAIFKRIVLVNTKTERIPESPYKQLIEPAPIKLQQKYANYADLNVRSRSLADWYCLLRKTQGDLMAYKDNLYHMVDDIKFITESDCEAGYIINLDDNVFEIYEPKADKPNLNRYSIHEPDEDNYYGPILTITFSLSNFPDNWIKQTKAVSLHFRRQEADIFD